MSARHIPVAFILAGLAAAVFAVSGAVAFDDEPQSRDESKAGESESNKETAAKGGEKGDEPVRLYTNEDLERLFGPPPPPKAAEAGATEAAPGAPKLPDALDAMQDAQARARTRELQAAEVEKVVAEKRARVEMLEQRILRIRNPLLPRPEVDLTPEERTEWAGLTAPQRVELTQTQLDQARKELSDAEARLKELKSK